ncbi:hypothetical protein F2Q69_00034674 [Brassica cretica]|uniref:DUF7028 domain-containing protein n=1 Tax=Brassica cretica TaxID=69181 RepID=A0A8S9SSN6_BRACR|nr:hypothetical protein F2Q69_00034674 [Brassica cretica]
MERGGRRSGGVLIKKRSSSGCLILKKKSDGLANFSPFPETSDSESSDKPLMAHYGNVEETRFGVKRDYPEDCFLENSREWKERHRLKDDDELLRRSYDGSRVGIGKKLCMGSAQFGGTNKECGTASSSKYLDIIERKRRRPCLDKVGGNESIQRNYKLDMNSDRPIRVQGKNGVLKVMPNKHNRMLRGGLPQSSTHVQPQKPGETGKIRVAIQSQPAVKTEIMLPPARIHSNGLKIPIMKSKGHDQDSEDSDSSGRLQKRITQPHKVLKIEREQTLPEAPKTREGKVKRGSGTEKQRLRERIREMLLDAGWTIDYRPRRNRDYLDAVYISPRGTAYWSIIKAYEALLKQVNSGEEVAKPREVGSAATLISDEILSQLTRKTKRKIEKDMKRVEECANDSDGQGSLGDFTAPLDEAFTHGSLTVRNIVHSVGGGLLPVNVSSPGKPCSFMIGKYWRSLVLSAYQ